jgi:hypothetical protein
VAHILGVFQVTQQQVQQEQRIKDLRAVIQQFPLILMLTTPLAAVAQVQQVVMAQVTQAVAVLVVSVAQVLHHQLQVHQ